MEFPDDQNTEHVQQFNFLGTTIYEILYWAAHIDTIAIQIWRTFVFWRKRLS